MRSVLGCVVVLWLMTAMSVDAQVCRTCPPPVRQTAPAPYVPGTFSKRRINVTVNVTNPPPTLNVPPPFVPGWRELFIEQAIKRDEYGAYLTMADKMGYALPSLFSRQTARGYAFSTSNETTLSYGAVGGNGSSLYGYSLKDAVDAYGSLDPNVLYQQSYSLTKGAQEYTREAHGLHSDRVSEAAAGMARVAEIHARAKAAERMFRATEPAPSSVTMRSSTTVAPAVPAEEVAPVPAPRTMPRADEGEVRGEVRSDNYHRAFLTAYAAPACGGCHTGKEARGKFDVSTLPRLDYEGRRLVLKRILSDDPAKAMPRDAGNKHLPMTPEFESAFVRYLSRK